MLKDPEDGMHILVRISINVVFPAPFLPSKQNIYPLFTIRLSLFTALNLPYFNLYVLVNSEILMNVS